MTKINLKGVWQEMRSHAGRNESRPGLMQLHIRVKSDAVMFCTADAFRIAIRGPDSQDDLWSDYDFKFGLHQRDWRELNILMNKAKKYEVEISKEILVFEYELDGKLHMLLYPNYEEKLIKDGRHSSFEHIGRVAHINPHTVNEIVAPIDQLFETIKSMYNGDLNEVVKLEVREGNLGELILTNQNTDEFPSRTETLKISSMSQGDDAELYCGFNTNFLFESLKVIKKQAGKNGRVRIQFDGSWNPFTFSVIKAKKGRLDTPTRSILMPVKIKW